MKISRVLIRLAVMAAVVSPAALAYGQGGGANIAVIDINQVFKNHVRFKATMEQFKGELVAADKGFQDQAKQINSLIEQMKDLSPNQPDYHALEAKIAKMRADLEVNKQLKRKELSERESKIYFNTYREIEDSVAQLATRYNIAVVVPYDSSPIDANDPQEIARGLRRNLVYVNPALRLDITKPVLDDLNRSAVPAVGQQQSPIGVGGPR